MLAASAVKAEVRICYHNGMRGMLLMMLLMLRSCALQGTGYVIPCFGDTTRGDVTF